MLRTVLVSPRNRQQAFAFLTKQTNNVIIKKQNPVSGFGQGQQFFSQAALGRSSMTLSNRLGSSPNLMRGGKSCTPLYMQQQPWLSMQLGSVTHMSSFFGGGGRRGGNNMARGLGFASAGAVLLGKGKYILGALKLTKFASLGSMVLSVGAYATIFGLPYACGMVGLMLIHETGHALVMVNRGIPTSPMVFIPFVGAVVAMKKRPQDAWENALVAFGGPVLGSMGAGAVAMAASSTDSQLLYALADFGYMVNLFNLLPIGSLDGGQITDALSPYAGLAGLGLGGSLIMSGAISHPIFYLVMLTGGYQTFNRFYYPHDVPANYYRISTQQRTALGAGYVGLIAAIFAGMAVNNKRQKPPEVVQREMMRELSFDMR